MLGPVEIVLVDNFKLHFGRLGSSSLWLGTIQPPLDVFVPALFPVLTCVVVWAQGLEPPVLVRMWWLLLA